MGEKLVAEKGVIMLLISGAFPRLRKLYFKVGTMSKYCKRSILNCNLGHVCELLEEYFRLCGTVVQSPNYERRAKRVCRAKENL